MSEIEFVDELPIPVGEAGNWKSNAAKAFGDALRANPRRWGKWPTPIGEATCYTYRNDINGGRKTGFPAGEFEAAVSDGCLWVRFMGGDAS
ncbi:hypothetical protein [Nocardia sp. N2S4-5]|uniref:hypothetical protein n=1 Tax=Nocardia sp. N2S4-5 TaxID=3351565 RepID=UPI0037D4AFCE